MTALGHGVSSSAKFTHLTNTYPFFGVAFSVTLLPYAFKPAPLAEPAALALTDAATLYFRTVQRA